MRRAGKGGFGRRGVAKLGIEADIRRRVVDMRRILPRRRGRFDHRGQNLVLDFHLLGGVFGRVHRLGDDHGDRLADEARFVGRQRVMPRLERRHIALVAQLGFRRMRRPRLVRNRL
jgi:hypothetical protein